MKICRNFLSIFFLLLITTAFAQKAKLGKTPSMVKYKVPKLTTTLGTFKDTSFIAPQMADSIIGLSLKITDVKNITYTLSSYQFLYKKIVTTEDENTGKASKTSSIKSSFFRATPLPEIWLNAVRENLNPGEELFFFAVTVKDQQGRIMYAPDLKIILR